MIRIGFVLLTHSQPDQILALTRVLNDLYDDPPIVCHHDFSQCSLDRAAFTPNVHFVEPHLHTFWGCFSVVPATLAAIRILMSLKDAPDWFYLLSGSDYPAASRAQVQHKLEQSRYDAFIDHREISWSHSRTINSVDVGAGFTRPSYISLAYRRYCAVAVPRPALKKPWAVPPVGRAYLQHPVWRKLIPGPFHSNFHCFAGEHWFTANGAAAEHLLSESSNSRRLFAYLSRRESPEECYYHSILGNSGLRLSNDNLRYIDWPSADAWHPKTLTHEDLPSVLASGAHFARKVRAGSSLIQGLNRSLGVSDHVLQ